MNKTVATLLVTISAVIMLHAFRSLKNSGINGNVNAPDNVIEIIAVNNKDSIKIQPDKRGLFSCTGILGNWKIVINAKEPYKDVVLDKIEVINGRMTEIGEIILQQ